MNKLGLYAAILVFAIISPWREYAIALPVIILFAYLHYWESKQKEKYGECSNKAFFLALGAHAIGIVGAILYVGILAVLDAFFGISL